MKSKTKRGVLRFALNLLHYGNSCYIEKVAELEKVLAKKPRRLQIDLLGEGEISAEWAMLLREVMSQHSPKTSLITNARSSLQNGSVLVWLAGDQRLMAPHVRLFFRQATVKEETQGESAKVWDEEKLKYSDSDADPDEATHARLLQLINEYLPVKELAGKMIDVSTLRQFGLVENDRFDRLLAEAFEQASPDANKRTDAPKKIRTKSKSANSTPVQK